MANILTTVRIICSIALLFVPTFSPSFYVLYLFAGFSDMIDGTVARKMNTVSQFGSVLDTLADFIFIIVCLIKILPLITIPIWLWIWITVIAAIKVFNIAESLVVEKRVLANHTALNKVTGFILFILPLTLPFISITLSSPVVCAVATIAAIQEGFTSHNIQE